MHTLEQALRDHELIVLRVIGEWWDLDLTGLDGPACVEALVGSLGALSMAEEMQFLPPEESAALQELAGAGGRMPVATFARKYGEIRLMGPGRLERDEPWLDPVSVAEALWYRGFLYRAFDETAEGMIEFVYLPAELLAQLAPADAPATAPGADASAGLSPAPPPATPVPADTHAVDDQTTILAEAQRTGLQGEARESLGTFLMDDAAPRLSLLLTLGHEMGLLRRSEAGIRPARAAVSWLRQSRESQLRALAEAWSSSNWNELRRLPELICEGEGWENDPILARTALFEALPRDGAWYRLADLIARIKEIDPDFQRPDGNYETWYIRDAVTDAYLAGFAHWDQVEGRLLAYLVTHPMAWLGLVETDGAPAPETTYRLTARAVAWLRQEPVVDKEVSVPLVVQPDGTLLVPYNCDRYHRFQAARITIPEPPRAPGQPYRYRLSPASLGEANAAGIAPGRILQFLAEASGRPVPASVRRGVERWSERGVEGRLEAAVILRVRDAEILETLLHNPKTRDYFGERLGELAVAIRADRWSEFRSATAELGLLLDADAAPVARNG